MVLQNLIVLFVCELEVKPRPLYVLGKLYEPHPQHPLLFFFFFEIDFVAQMASIPGPSDLPASAS
jgi:hypothetical protein